MVASRYPLKNKSVQLTRRVLQFVDPLAKSTSSLPRYFPYFTCCREPVSMLFFVVQALALRRPGFFHKSTISFWFHVPNLRDNTPTTEAKCKNNNSIHLKFFAPLHIQESRAGRTRDAQKMCALAIGATVLKKVVFLSPIAHGLPVCPEDMR